MWGLAAIDLAVCAAGPGVLLLRRVPWRPLEKMVAGVGLSLVCAYLAGFAIFAAGLDRRWHWAVSAACWMAAVIALPDWRRLLRNRQTRATAGILLLLWAWSLLLTSVVRAYSGGTWSGDWVEHWERCRFFLGELPRDYKFLGMYGLGARPPMMNVLGAHALVIGGGRFEAFQAAFGFLNLLVVPACLLIVDRVWPAWVRRPWAVAAALAINPVLAANVLYPWTKLFAGFYALTGLGLYAAGWRRHKGSNRIAGSIAALSAGMVVHYSAGPYAVVAAAHSVFAGRVWRRARAVVVGLLAAAVIAGTWFAWAVASYGTAATFRGNTVAEGLSGRSVWGDLDAGAWNVVHSVIPHAAVGGWPALRRTFAQASAAGMVRDVAFTLYQGNAVLMIGSAAGVVAVALLWRAFRRTDDAASRPWAAIVPVVVALGLMVGVSAEAEWGVAHLCLAPLGVLGAAYVAARARRLPSWVRAVLLAGWTVDAAAGVLLPVWLMSFGATGVERQSLWARINWAAKEKLGVTFIGDQAAAAAAQTALLLLIGLGTLFWLTILARRLWRDRR